MTEKDIKETDTEQVRILIADDDQTNLMILEAFLKNCGYSDITTAINGQDTLDKLAEASFDILLTDLQMPVMDGFASSRAIRQSELPCADMPIIAVSAAINASSRTEAIDSGIDAFIPKPVLQDELERVVTEQLSNISGRKAAA